MSRKWSAVFVLALLCVVHLAWATSGIVSAKVFTEYTVRMGAWARPMVPGQPVDVGTMMLGDDVSDVLTIMVVRDANQVTPTPLDLAGFCADVASRYLPAQRTVAESAVTLPSTLSGSRGYWGEEPWGSSALICSLQDDAVYLFALLSTDTDPETTQAIVTRLASDALTAGPDDQATQYLESVARRFGGERVLTEIPGSDAIPEEFQFVDTDYQFGSQ